MGDEIEYFIFCRMQALSGLFKKYFWRSENVGQNVALMNVTKQE